MKIEMVTTYEYEADGEQPYIATIKVCLPVEPDTKHLITEFRSDYESIGKSTLSKYWGYYDKERDIRTIDVNVYGNDWFEAQLLAEQARARIKMIIKRVYERNIESITTMPSATRHEVSIGE